MSSRPDGSRRFERRRVLQLTSTVGLATVAPGSVRQLTRDGSPPAATPPPDGTVEHAHPTELPTLRRQVKRYETHDEPTALYNPALVEELRQAPDAEELDLVVQTTGRRNVLDVAGAVDRTIRGWRPSKREADALADFGDVGFVGEVTTTVPLRGVSRDDLPSIAALPFVLSITLDPPLAVDRPGQESTDGVSISALRGEDYFRFSELPDDVSIPSWLRIGIVDRGYGGAGAFDGPHAEAMGIDEDLARDFTDEGGWRGDDDHGSNVANTCAALLPDGHDELFVPLKVVPTGRTPSRTDVRDNLRAAIEYAEKRGIAVLNVSLSTRRSRAACPSVYCPELYSYAEAGFLPFAAIGNRDVEGVTFPGGEWCTIGVGGVGGTCPGGNRFARYLGEDGYYGSSYGTVSYHDPFADETYCHYCRSFSEKNGGFSPTVYGCYLSETDAGETLVGTSFAAPQAAAAGALLSGTERPSYEAVVSAFQGMDRYGICPGEAARGGQLLDAEAAYRTAVEQPDEPTDRDETTSRWMRYNRMVRL